MSIFGDLSPMLLLLGLAAGILSAMLGVGSGILLVPALTLAFALSQKSAQGTALAVMVPMAFVGAMRYVANPDIEINFMRVGLLAVGAIVGAFIGSAIASHLPNAVLRRIFAVFLLVVAVRMLLPKRQPAKQPEPDSSELSIPGGNQ